jgi:hypothetical protein
MLQTIKFNNKKWKKSLFYKEKSLVGLTPGGGSEIKKFSIEKSPEKA